MCEMKKKILLTWNFIEHKWFAWQRLNLQYEYILLHKNMPIEHILAILYITNFPFCELFPNTSLCKCLTCLLCAESVLGMEVTEVKQMIFIPKYFAH